jgi:hypothetical protein
MLGPLPPSFLPQPSKRGSNVRPRFPFPLSDQENTEMMQNNRFRPEVEHLESREVPGSLLNLGQPDTSGLLIMAAAAQVHQRDDAEPVPLALRRDRVIIVTPRSDAVIIATDRDGTPSPFLDRAHEVYPPEQPQDGRSVQSIIEAIQDAFARKGSPVDVTLVAYGDGKYLIVGRSYLYLDGPDTQQIIASCQGMLSSLTVIAHDGEKHPELLQQLANGLGTSVTGFRGTLVVQPDNGGTWHFLRPPGEELHYTPR